MYEYPLYEQRRNLDRQAGLTLEVSDKKQSELKRKHDEEQSKTSIVIDEEKHKRGKMDKEDRKAKYRKEQEEKAKEEEEEEEKKKAKKEEEEKSKRIKEEKYKFNKREEMERRYKHNKEGVGRSKYHKTEEDDWHKYRREEEGKQKYSREDEDRSRSSRVDERPKFSWSHNNEDEDNRSRYGKWEEQSPKYNKKYEQLRSERGEGKCKNEDEKESRPDKGVLQKEGKSEPRKQFEPEKHIDPPKVFCGPNPALRAKLRKKSEETTKVEPKAQHAFGKFSWKKKQENDLAKEAERVAADFLKEDETVAEEDDPDAFSKSVAAAKSIAIKLSGKTVIPATNTWVPFNSGKIRPNLPALNLPAPSMVLRKSSGLGPWVYAKPALLKTVPAVRPPGVSDGTPPPVVPNQPTYDPVLAPDVISKAFSGEEVDVKTTADNIEKPDSTSNPVEHPDGTVKQVPTSTPEKNKALKIESVCQANSSSPSAVMPEFKAPLPPAPPPALTMMTMKSDVSAPGVPESEQNVPVMVTPPPFMQRPTNEAMNKSEKPKSSLAAANAQDLFDIFYSSCSTASTTSTICMTTSTRAVVESRSEPHVSENSKALESMFSPQIQPKLSAYGSSHTDDSETQESMETERGSDLQQVLPTEVMYKSAKPKSSLAAGNAKDLFDLFYCSHNTASTTSTICKSTSIKAVVESSSETHVSEKNKVLEPVSPQTQPTLSIHDNSHTTETASQGSSETESGSDTQPKEICKEFLETAPVQLNEHRPASDNSNAVETHRQEAMEIETGSDPQSNEETLEESSADNLSDPLGVSNDNLDLPTEVLGLGLFDFNFD